MVKLSKEITKNKKVHQTNSYVQVWKENKCLVVFDNYLRTVRDFLLKFCYFSSTCIGEILKSECGK